MPDFLCRATQKSDPYLEAKYALEWLKEEYPYMYDVLAGCPAKNGDAERMPGSIRLFTNGGSFKAEIGGPEWIMRGYLVLPTDFNLGLSIEGELKAGRIGWTAKTERNATSPKVPY